MLAVWVDLPTLYSLPPRVPRAVPKRGLCRQRQMSQGSDARVAFREGSEVVRSSVGAFRSYRWCLAVLCTTTGAWFE